MRSKQNFILIILIIFLLSAIFGIDNLEILSTTHQANNDRNYSGREIKVSNKQLPQNKERINIEIIWDLSQSMWGEIERVDKVVTSKEILKNIISNFPDDVYLGLRVFGAKDGHSNSYLATPLAQDNKKALVDCIQKLQPAGKSPIGLSLIKAGEDLKKVEGKKHILLLTDGKDNGTIMPARVVNDLKEDKIKTHIIQVGNLDRVSQLNLKTLSRLGEGKYFTYFEEEKIVPIINLN